MSGIKARCDGGCFCAALAVRHAAVRFRRYTQVQPIGQQCLSGSFFGVHLLSFILTLPSGEKLSAGMFITAKREVALCVSLCSAKLLLFTIQSRH
jgi:hypothetical protein